MSEHNNQVALSGQSQRAGALPETMTIAQIAELCGVDDKTVRRWVDKLSNPLGQNVQALPEIKQKMILAGEAGIAAKLTHAEAIAIIRAGGKATLADVLQTNIVLEEQVRQLQAALAGRSGAANCRECDLFNRYVGLNEKHMEILDRVTIGMKPVTRAGANLPPAQNIAVGHSGSDDDRPTVTAGELSRVCGRNEGYWHSQSRKEGWEIKPIQAGTKFKYFFILDCVPEPYRSAILVDRVKREAQS
jgi:hypothetical protein